MSLLKRQGRFFHEAKIPLLGLSRDGVGVTHLGPDDVDAPFAVVAGRCAMLM